MGSIEIILAQVVPYLLVAFRLAGLMIFAPVVSSMSIPPWPKAIFIAMAAAALYPMVPHGWSSAAAPTVFSLLPVVLSEMLAGAVMGLVAALPLLFLQSAGFIIGHQMGLNLVASYSPDEATSDAIGQLLLGIGTSGFIVVGGLEALFLGLAGTFERVPAGSLGLADVPLDGFIAAVTAGTELALRLAMPVVGTLLILLLVLGVLSRVVPQLNLMTIGFTFKVLAGLAMLAWSIFAVSEVAGDEITAALVQALSYARSLGAEGP
ncbi:MAG: flagellar biosynthetic protein FliR [Phycisphaerales bacterium]|nr:flagellar biosynthetic protein FliR [Phycisphaerales bacterium]